MYKRVLVTVVMLVVLCVITVACALVLSPVSMKI